ncbi:DUF2057 family protein [uncultured Vibrio sp.]|uniref:DUF2057 family protein n=1 Tax=uncultured Vibrio sp. TaxID=114054 RepID=UPI000919A1B4|nr:DUF2057 family protein [uncultured Vibrio sp.]OIQ25960.1 MAG: hypothetical protein BM561_03770 [Vibrio sp. MedPE-SWchi]
MYLKKSWASVLILAPSLSFASVSIDIPRGVQLLTVNGEDAGYSSLGFDYRDNLTLNNGVNQVVFRISKIVRESGSDKTKYKSTPLVATFNESDTKLFMKVPKIDTFDQGMTFDSKPEFTLAIEGSDFEPDSLVKDSLNIGFKLMPDMVQEVSKYNQSNEIASLKRFENNTNNIQASTSSKLSANSNYEALKEAYLEVEDKDKKRFLTWAISNFE